MDPTDVDAAVLALEQGRLVILPTETVYGLAAAAADPSAVAAVFEAKGRPRFNPLIAHVGDLETGRRIARFDARAERLARAFWPGPLTLVLPIGEREAVCDLARAGLDTVAVRAPDHPLARETLRRFGRPVVAPSANRSGRPSPTTFVDAMEETGEAAAAGLDGGPCRVGVESTVVALLEGPARLLRPGAVTRDALERIVGPLAEAESHAHRSPGRLLRHYAPEAPVRLEASEPRQGEAYLAFGSPPRGSAVFQLSATGDLREAAARLFALLRAADATQPSAIAVAPIPDQGLGEAINDRLRRAAGHVG
ncbi:MAG TPA: L-threonylcarbamoyladenylate synthase [Caulobacteraceae bacterium]|nr:L-threonylcarbamoyladenylate synthase [Caulobacteraceae bacterium]